MRKRSFIYTALLSGLLLTSSLSITGCSSIKNPFSQSVSDNKELAIHAVRLYKLNKTVGVDIDNLEARYEKIPEGKYSDDVMAMMRDTLKGAQAIHTQFNEIITWQTNREHLRALLAFQDNYIAAKQLYVKVRADIPPKVYATGRLQLIDKRFIAIDTSMTAVFKRIRVGKKAIMTDELEYYLSTLKLIFGMNV